MIEEIETFKWRNFPGDRENYLKYTYSVSSLVGWDGIRFCDDLGEPGVVPLFLIQMFENHVSDVRRVTGQYSKVHYLLFDGYNKWCPTVSFSSSLSPSSMAYWMNLELANHGCVDYLVDDVPEPDFIFLSLAVKMWLENRAALLAI